MIEVYKITINNLEGFEHSDDEEDVARDSNENIIYRNYNKNKLLHLT